MFVNAALVNVIAITIAVLFYFRKARAFPYLRAASLYNYVLWLTTAFFAWRFMIDVSLISPIYEFVSFLVVVVFVQCIVNILAHVLARFTDD